MRKIYLALLLMVTGLLVTGNLYAQPSITYTTLVPSCAGSDVVLSGVSITDGVGVPTVGALMPRIYFRKNSGAWFSTQGVLTSGSGTSGTWDFTIVASMMGGLTPGSTLSYFVIAQNTASAIDANPGAGLVASDVNTVTAPPTSPNSYSVNPIPSLSSFTASSGSTCVGSPVTLTAGSTSGTGGLVSYNWSGPNSYSSTSSTSSIVFIPASTLATGVYSLNVTYPGDGCNSATRTTSITVNGALPAISGSGNLCIGTTTTLSDATPGGNWSSSSPSIASINIGTGVATGLAVGNTTITYTVGACISTTVLTVDALPLPITGSMGVCIGNTSTLSSATPGGNWTSGNTAVATATTTGPTTGDITGVTNGVASITYTMPTGCMRSVSVTVSPFPTPITGTFVVCEGSATDLISTPGSGLWSSSDISVATVGSVSGSVTGVNAGTATITYAIGTGGCIATVDVTVNPRPSPIAGALTTCIGSTSTLSSPTPGGAWSSSTLTIATVDAFGVVTGVANGTSTISYTLPTGCARLAVMTVNPLPAMISGPNVVCEGSNISLTSSPYTTGTWSSSDVTIATVGSTGVVTGVLAGTTNLSFIFPSGCFRTMQVTVNPTPVPITGSPAVCSGFTTTLSNATPGGVWTGSAGAIFVVDATTGVVTGVSSGTAPVSYSLGTGCRATVMVTTYITPPAIGGSGSVCAGSTTTLTNGQTGGVWTSSTPSVATISSGPGLVTGLSVGTTDITYTSAPGCFISKTMTVQPIPNPITGNFDVCLGTSNTLSTTSTGGLWYSSSSSTASVGAATGVVTGVSLGTATISYKLSTGCAATAVVTVDALPAAITGNSSICVGSTNTLFCVSTGGAWSSSNGSIASVDAFGNVTGVAVGTAYISYTVATGCYSTRSVTVNPVPFPITGTTTLCVGTSSGLADPTTGGTWSSSNTGIATVGASGIVTGISAGVANITYTLISSCKAITSVNVLPVPAPITGTAVACVGATSALTSATAGGTWSSNTITIASVDATGLVSANNAGTATISYTMPTGCKSKLVFTVQATPSAITGTPIICTGQTAALGSTPSGGVWSSSDLLVATTSGSNVTGIAAGTSTIYYTLSTGCSRSIVATVNATPPVSTGTNAVCIGSTTTLSNAMPGGVWSTSSATVATVGVATGVVTGINSGAANISYTLPTGCKTVTNVVVSALPVAILGTASACETSSSTLTNATAGGTWSSSNPGVASVGSSSGVVVGVTAGTSTISYTVVTTGCVRTRTFTVNALPGAITGSTTLCVGSTSALSSSTLGGTWTSSASTIASVNASSGVVTGVSNGTANITYKLSTGCQVTTTVSVNFLPGAIGGSGNVCVGGTTVYTDLTPGGAWSSSNPLIASINPATGLITGVSNGTAIITYSLGSGCIVTRPVTVLPPPAAISGTTTVCEGGTTNLSSVSTGGTWSSGNTLTATVGLSNGVVTGVAAGITNITYTLGNGCATSVSITVNQTPAAISGTLALCNGYTSLLTSLTVGGSWSTGNPLVATINASTGLATATGVGTTIVTYLLPTGCRTTAVATVNPVPAPISGVPNVCVGSTRILTDGTAGGTWTSSDVTIATIGSTGVATGISAGSVTISYITANGCASLMPFTVNPIPAVISGATAICIGNTSTLTNATTGGAWTSSNPAVATINVTSGLMTGVGAGTTVITYGLSTSCRVYTVATVSPLPTAITGNFTVCEGSTTVLGNSVAGGSWSSDLTAVATVDAAFGIVTGTGAGLDTIRYTLPGGCATAVQVTVVPAPPAIVGNTNLCSGQTSLLTNAVAGGSWTTSNPAIATIGLGSGLVTGVSTGVVNITYILGAGCRVVTTATVNPSPSPITGPANVCQSQSVTLFNTVAGGTWSSDDVSVAPVDGVLGVVTGIASGTDTIRYTLPGGCYVKFGMTVNPTPAVMGGPDSLCQGSTAALTNAVPGGIWTSSDPSVAPIGLSTGIVTGINPGTSIISYTILGTGCFRTETITVNPLPSSITGNVNICQGALTVLSTTSVGGTWSSSDLTVAVIGSGTGFATGLAPGIATITYRMPTGCISTTLLVVNPLPNAITGATVLCAGSFTTLASSTGFGTWSSSITSVATIGSATGTITGIAAGTSIITYKLLTTGCYVTQQITVNPVPPPISGNANICIGTTTFLTNLASPGGTWSSSNPSVATIDGSGNVTSVAIGSTTISYTLSTACYVTRTLNVETTLNPITGTATVCEFATTTLSNSYVGGVWTSSDLSKATVGSTGVVTGVANGTAIITYATPLAGCAATKQVTIYPIPAALTGTAQACEGFTSTLADVTPGGTWSSGDVSIATVGSTGVVTGIVANTVRISYTIGTGCSNSVVFTVNPQPHAGTISGPTEVCLDASITLSSTVADGKWWSTDTGTVNIDSVTGVISPSGVGTTSVIYVYTNMCGTDTGSYNVLVKPLPDAGILSGTTGLCINYTSTLSSTISGGVWTSGNTAIATINPSTGVVTALSAGTTMVSYLMTTSCGTDTATILVTVYVMAPHTSIAIHPDTVLCLNSQYRNFGVDSAAPSGIAYAWSAVNAEVWATSPDKQNAIVSFWATGTAVVRVMTKYTGTGCFVMDSFVVNIKPESAFTSGVKYFADELICTDNAAGSYQWGYDDAVTLDSNIIKGAIQQSYYLPVPDFTGKRYWVIAEHGGCYQKMYYNTPTGVAPVVGDIDVKLFPNPADSRVNIVVEGLGFNDEVSVRVVDMFGKEVTTSALVNGRGSIDVANFPSGIYSVMFINNGMKVAAKTFVKN